MDIPLCPVHRGEAIDGTRDDILNRTLLTFLPRRQVQFLQAYSNLPGEKYMSIRDRIKLISDDYQRKFLRRVETAVQHTRQAEIDRVSEFNWEADAWRDVFGRLRDDERLRMDKREYNYKTTVLNPSKNNKNNQNTYVGKRIPDITFGLSSYTSGEPKDEGIDMRERRIRRPFQSDNLFNSVWTFDGNSVIADGKWGEYTILFPFAVYEAKRDQKSETGVKIQLKLAFNTYLKMLDRLVRRPGKVDEYQSLQSSVFPIFGFTSSGGTWRVYVGYLPNCVKKDSSMDDDPLCDEDSHMKLIWWGNIYNRQDAGELVDIVDQIHEYAVTTHRSFVARHLEAWERFNELHKQRRRWEGDNLNAWESSDSEADPGWFDLKFNSKVGQKLLRGKRKRGALLTDDDVKRATLEANLKEWDSKKSNLLVGERKWAIGIPRRPGLRAAQAVGIRKQPLRKCRAN